MKILIVHCDRLSKRFWEKFGDVCESVGQFMAEPNTFGLVCFTGGADISPELYGHNNLASSINRARDEREVLIFSLAQQHQIPMTGICRGSQFLNAMCGGTIVQNLGRKHQGRNCKTLDERIFEVVCSHHQMCVLGEGGEVLSWAENPVEARELTYDGPLSDLLPHCEDQETTEVGPETLIRVTEAIHYPEQKVFAVQNHPEWQNINSDAAMWTLNKTQELCFGGRQETNAG